MPFEILNACSWIEDASSVVGMSNCSSLPASWSQDLKVERETSGPLVSVVSECEFCEDGNRFQMYATVESSASPSRDVVNDVSGLVLGSIRSAAGGRVSETSCDTTPGRAKGWSRQKSRASGWWP